MTPLLLFSSVQINDAATADKDRFVTPPLQGGEWKVKSAYWNPDTAATADAGEKRVLSLKNGATTLASADTSVTAWVAGTPVSLTPSGAGKTGEFTGGTDAVEIDSTHTGATGRAASGVLNLVWERIS